MKRLLPAMTLALAICLGTNAQTKESPVKPQVTDVLNNGNAVPTSNADIKFEKLTHDYGTVKWGSDGNCEFKFTNTGKDPLVLSMCQGSCGCTVPTCPKEPILPGKSGSIKVHYDTKRPGPINKQVTVTSNAKSGQIILKITGTVEPQPVEEPFPTEKKDNGAIPIQKGN